MTAGSTIDVAGGPSGRRAAAGPRRAGAAARSSSGDGRGDGARRAGRAGVGGDLDELVEHAGRSVRPRGARHGLAHQPHASPGLTLPLEQRVRRGRPCSSAGGPRSVRARRAAAASPATIRSNRNSSSSTSSSRPPRLGAGDDRRRPPAARRRRRGHARPHQRWPAAILTTSTASAATPCPPNSCSTRPALSAAVTRRVGQGPAQRRRSPSSTSATREQLLARPRAGPPRPCQDASSAARGAASDSRAERACISDVAAASPRLGAGSAGSTVSGSMSPASSSARNRSTMPRWRASSCERLADDAAGQVGRQAADLAAQLR